MNDKNKISKYHPLFLLVGQFLGYLLSLGLNNGAADDQVNKSNQIELNDDVPGDKRENDSDERVEHQGTIKTSWNMYMYMYMYIWTNSMSMVLTKHISLDQWT